jgi:hypothetical protein
MVMARTGSPKGEARTLEMPRERTGAVGGAWAIGAWESCWVNQWRQFDYPDEAAAFLEHLREWSAALSDGDERAGFERAIREIECLTMEATCPTS